MYLIDAHCHLHEPWFKDDLQQVINEAKEKSVEKLVNCASDPRSFDQVKASSAFGGVWYTLGMQPTLADKHLHVDPIRPFLDDPKLVAIGEVGLDYYWVKDEKLRAKQELLFISAIDLANEAELPLVIHSRKAESECLDLLEKHAQVPVLLHSFDGNLKQINRALDLGYLISVPTNVTRRKNRRKVTVRAGIDHIVVETDAPFCQPREEIERNEPQYIPLAARYMADLLELEIDEFASITTENAEEFYKI